MNDMFFFLVAGGIAMGSSLGSFFAAWRDRSQRGLKCDNPPRSECPGCKRTLRWWENVPLVSFIAQRGRCLSCGWKIPFWYFGYELAGAGAGAAAGAFLWGVLGF